MTSTGSIIRRLLEPLGSLRHRATCPSTSLAAQSISKHGDERNAVPLRSHALSVEVDAGPPNAATRLIELLAEQGKRSKLSDATVGRNPDGSIADGPARGDQSSL